MALDGMGSNGLETSANGLPYPVDVQLLSTQQCVQHGHDTSSQSAYNVNVANSQKPSGTEPTKSFPSKYANSIMFV